MNYSKLESADYNTAATVSRITYSFGHARLKTEILLIHGQSLLLDSYVFFGP